MAGRGVLVTTSFRHIADPARRRRHGDLPGMSDAEEESQFDGPHRHGGR